MKTMIPSRKMPAPAGAGIVSLIGAFVEIIRAFLEALFRILGGVGTPE